jgi:nucleoside-diphosphate-sugar epimerase
MKAFAIAISILVAVVQGFSPHQNYFSASSVSLSSTGLYAEMDRRSALTSAVSLLVGAAGLSIVPETSFAAQDAKIVVVAGATGQTGRRVLERLAAKPGLIVIGGVRNVDKASKSLSESSTVVRGAMVQQVSSIDTSKVDLKHLDVVQDSVDTLKETLSGADSLVIAVGFVPGNPLKMNEEAHKVDNLGTIKLIDAAKAAGVKKVVLVSSILTDGRAWGQEKSPGFVVTNAFGNVLDEKIVAEKYLRASGLDYTIVRPGGLKAKPRKFRLLLSRTVLVPMPNVTFLHRFIPYSFGGVGHFRRKHPKLWRGIT